MGVSVFTMVLTTLTAALTTLTTQAAGELAPILALLPLQSGGLNLSSGALTAFPPAFLVLGAALLVPFLPRGVGHAIGGGAAALVAIWSYVVPVGAHLPVRFLGFEAVLFYVDGASQLMGIIFGLIGAGAVLYSYASEAENLQTAYALSYVGTSLGAVFAGDWLTLLFFWELMAVTRPNVPLLLGIVGTFAVTVVGLTFVQGLVPIAVLSVVIGYVIHSVFPVLDTYMLSSLPDRHRASAYALYSSSMMLVQAGGSGVIGTAVAGGLGYDAAFRGSAIGVSLVVATLFVLYRTDRLPAGGIPGKAPA